MFFPGSNPTAAGGNNSCRVSSRGSKSFTELDQGFPWVFPIFPVSVCFPDLEVLVSEHLGDFIVSWSKFEL